MQITVRLFATLRDGRGKVIMMEMPIDSMPKDILERLQISEQEVSILLINGKDREMDTPLMESDVLSIFPPVGGG